MTEIIKPLPGGRLAEADNNTFLGRNDNPNNTRNPAATQGAIVAAIKDLSLEAAYVASISARHFLEKCEAIAHLREAAAQFRAWQGKPVSRIREAAE